MNEQLGAGELAARYGVTRRRANQYLHRMREEGVMVSMVGGRMTVALSDLDRWEEETRQAGRPFPGERKATGRWRIPRQATFTDRSSAE